jgi:hypothetical protein
MDSATIESLDSLQRVNVIRAKGHRWTRTALCVQKAHITKKDEELKGSYLRVYILVNVDKVVTGRLFIRVVELVEVWMLQSPCCSYAFQGSEL